MYIWIGSCLQDMKSSGHGESITGQVVLQSIHYQGRRPRHAGTPRFVRMAHETWSVWLYWMWVTVWGGRRLGCQWDYELTDTVWWIRPLLGVSLEIPSQSAPAFGNTTVTAVHSPLCVGHKLCWRKAQVPMVPLALFAAWWTYRDHDLCLWRDTPRYLAVAASV